MKQYCLCLLSFFMVIAAQCQDILNTSIKKQSPTYAVLKLMDGHLYKGWLYKANTDEVFLIEKKKVLVPFAGIRYEKTRSPDLPTRFSVDQIDKFSLRKKNAGLKGALIGLGVGAATGAIIGLVSGDDPVQPHRNSNNAGTNFQFALVSTTGEKIAIGAIGLGLVGSITGLIIGNGFKKKFIIGGSTAKMPESHRLIMQKPRCNIKN
jgi:hypothetical protein